MKKDQKSPTKIKATLTGETERIFNWLKRYDPEFKGSNDEEIIQHLLKLGVEALVKSGAENWVPPGQ